MEISKDLNHSPLVIVRFNPDGYALAEKGKVPSPWRVDKTADVYVQIQSTQYTVVGFNTQA